MLPRVGNQRRAGETFKNKESTAMEDEAHRMMSIPGCVQKGDTAPPDIVRDSIDVAMREIGTGRLAWQLSQTPMFHFQRDLHRFAQDPQMVWRNMRTERDRRFH
jgi:hypothetical protein